MNRDGTASPRPLGRLLALAFVLAGGAFVLAFLIAGGGAESQAAKPAGEVVVARPANAPIARLGSIGTLPALPKRRPEPGPPPPPPPGPVTVTPVAPPPVAPPPVAPPPPPQPPPPPECLGDRC